MKITNKTSRPLTIAATGQQVEPGDSAEVDADTAKALLEQPDVWAEAKAPTKTTKAGPSGDDIASEED